MNNSLSNKRRWPGWVYTLIGVTIICIAKETYHSLKETYSNGPATNQWVITNTIIQEKGKELIKDPFTRHKWCDCVMAKLEQKYPGGFSNLSKDTLRNAAQNISYECMTEIKESGRK